MSSYNGLDPRHVLATTEQPLASPIAQEQEGRSSEDHRAGLGSNRDRLDRGVDDGAGSPVVHKGDIGREVLEVLSCREKHPLWTVLDAAERSRAGEADWGQSAGNDGRDQF